MIDFRTSSVFKFNPGLSETRQFFQLLLILRANSTTRGSSHSKADAIVRRQNVQEYAGSA